MPGWGSSAIPRSSEVKRADFAVNTSALLARKPLKLIKRSLGRILFFDEFYSWSSVTTTGVPI